MKDVDPKLMQGFKLELFSSKITGADMVAQIREVAKARGIDVLVHDLNATRDDLLQAMCRAKGTVHYARRGCLLISRAGSDISWTSGFAHHSIACWSRVTATAFCIRSFAVL